MKRIKSILIVTVLSIGFNQFLRRMLPTPTSTIASGLGLYVFPSNNQDQATQDADEMACYKWAKEQIGLIPLIRLKSRLKR